MQMYYACAAMHATRSSTWKMKLESRAFKAKLSNTSELVLVNGRAIDGNLWVGMSQPSIVSLEQDGLPFFSSLRQLSG